MFWNANKKRELSELCDFYNEIYWRFAKRLEPSNVSEPFITHSCIKSVVANVDFEPLF